MAFGAKDQTSRSGDEVKQPHRSPSPQSDGEESEEEQEESSSKTFKTITERPQEEDEVTTNSKADPRNTLRSPFELAPQEDVTPNALMPNQEKRPASQLSGTDRNSDRYMQDFTDLKAKFQNILERDNANSQRPSSAQGQANETSEATAPMHQLNEGLQSDTTPRLHCEVAGEPLDMRALASSDRNDLTPVRERQEATKHLSKVTEEPRNESLETSQQKSLNMSLPPEAQAELA